LKAADVGRDASARRTALRRNDLAGNDHGFGQLRFNPRFEAIAAR
jgi:hypothetical protein